MGETAQQRYRLARWYFLVGQIGFFAALAVCVYILPQGLLANHGFSYYGKHAPTILPYRLAYVIAGVFTLLSARCLPATMPFRVIRRIFQLMLPLLLGLVATNTSAGPLMSHLHVGIGAALFVVQLLLVGWLASSIGRDRVAAALLILLVLGGVICILSLLVIIPYLLEGQILYQLAFGLLMLRLLRVLEPGALALQE